MSLIAALVAALERSEQDALRFGARRIGRLELAGQAGRLRRVLEAAGVTPGDRVALLCPNHPAFVVAQLAVLAAGAVLVPLNPLYSALELAALLRDSSPRLLLCFSTCEPLAVAARAALEPSGRPGLVVLIDPMLDPRLELSLRPSHAGSAAAERLQREAEAADDPRYHRIEPGDAGRLEPVPLPPDAPAVLIYTSGTTGAAKAAVLSHGNLASNARFIALEWLGGLAGEPPPPALPGHCPPGAPHRALGALPLCHNFGLNVTLDAVLMHGGTLVILPRFSAVEALRAIDAHRVSFLPLVPTMTQALLHNPEIDRVDTSSLRLLVSGGAALPGALRERATLRFPGIALRDTYGLSEASLAACTRPGAGGAASSGLSGGYGRPGTVGRPVAGTSIRVVDAAGRPCSVDEVGEIQIRGPGVMIDYWRRPVGQPAPVVEGWLSTGDLGRIDADGDLTLVDRKKDLVIHGGYKVFPLEVEEVLYQHPAVGEAAVFGVPDPRMGERVMACVAPREGARIDARELLAHCRRLLADFKVPASIEVRDALPRSATGKILRRVLRDEARPPTDRGPC